MSRSLSDLLRERRSVLSEHLKTLETQAAQVRGAVLEIDYLLEQYAQEQAAAAEVAVDHSCGCC